MLDVVWREAAEAQPATSVKQDGCRMSSAQHARRFSRQHGNLSRSDNVRLARPRAGSPAQRISGQKRSVGCYRAHRVRGISPRLPAHSMSRLHCFSRALQLTLLVVFHSACHHGSATPVASPAAVRSESPPVAHPSPSAPQIALASEAPTQSTVSSASARCSAADWSARPLGALLEPGKAVTQARADQQGAAQVLFGERCTDAPGGAAQSSPAPIVVDGVEIRVASATPAGSSQRGWMGNQCSFDVRLADGSGPTVHLGPEQVPPFTTVSALVRSGSALWLSVSFNGYSAEFPKGGNRVIALDLCQGRIAWKSRDSMSNGGLLLLGDYLISAYGFTNERRYVYVLDAHSGAVIQQLGVVENICPSKSWAPNWHRGERCDAPGQKVGAASNPRVEGGLFLVDTNTGSSAFQFQ